MINLKRIFGSDQPPATTPESLKIIYAEVTRVIHTYYEWRHKVITWYLTALSAVFVSTGWILEHHLDRYRLLTAILLLFSVASLILFFMDKVNTNALTQNYKIAKCLEKEMSKSQYFSVYESAHTRYIEFENSKFLRLPTNLKSYASILFWVYLLSTLVPLGFAIYFFCLALSIESPSSPENKCFCCTEISEKKCIVNKVH